MSETLRLVVGLIQRGEVRVSAHGYDELAADGILARDVIDGVEDGGCCRGLPDVREGALRLVRQVDANGPPIHAVWGIPQGEMSPAVLVTAYRPDPARWTDDFLGRRS